MTFPPRALVKPGEQVSEIRVYYEILPVLLGLPDFPRSPVQPIEKSYRIGNSTTHGRGMFATRQLKSGDLILSERPIIVCPGGVSMPVESRDIMSRLPKDDQMRLTLYHTEEKVRSLFARLDPDQQKRFLALHNCHQHDGSGPLSGISRTNGFGIPKLERVLRSAGYEGETGEPYSSVYDALSYINHRFVFLKSRPPSLYQFHALAAAQIQLETSTLLRFPCVCTPLETLLQAKRSPPRMTQSGGLLLPDEPGSLRMDFNAHAPHVLIPRSLTRVAR